MEWVMSPHCDSFVEEFVASTTDTCVESTSWCGFGHQRHMRLAFCGGIRVGPGDTDAYSGEYRTSCIASANFLACLEGSSQTSNFASASQPPRRPLLHHPPQDAFFR